MGIIIMTEVAVQEIDRYESIVGVGNDAGHSIDFMYAATGGYLAVAIINWVMVWAKYFWYIYAGIGYTRLLALITSFLGGDALAIQAALTDLLTRLTWPTPAALLLNTIFNSATMFWVMVYFRAAENVAQPQLSAFMRICQSTFWVWVTVGIGKPVLMALDWVFGTKKFDMADAYTQLALYEIAEWGFSFFLLVLYRGPLFAFYNTTLIEQARIIVAEFETEKPYMEAFGKKYRKDHESTKMIAKTQLTDAVADKELAPLSEENIPTGESKPAPDMDDESSEPNEGVFVNEDDTVWL